MFGTPEQQDSTWSRSSPATSLLLLDDRARSLRRRPDRPPDPGRPRRRRVGHQRRTSGSRPGPTARASPIVMAVTDPDAEPHRRMSQIIVPTDTPGFNIIRPVPVMGETEAGHALRNPLRGRARAGHEHARRARRRLPHRAEAPRTGPHPSLHALARPDAARVRPHVHVLARSARRSAARWPTSRRSRTGSPTRPPRSRPAAC